jgi:hypothetical protein
MSEPTKLSAAEIESLSLSLVRDDLLFRAQRRVGLIPANGLGVLRRVIFWPLFAWLPIAAWGLYHGRVVFPADDHSLLAHFGVHVRLLVALPLFIIAEGLFQRLTIRLLPYFVTSGIVPFAEVPAFRQALARTARLRDASFPWMVILAVVVANATLPQFMSSLHELAWTVAADDIAPRLSLGSWWFLYVARAVFAMLLLGWLWRVVLVAVLFWRVTQLRLSIVPTHPDRTGGMGFSAYLPVAFSPVVLGIGCVLGAHWAHDLVYHDATVQAIKWQMGAFVVVALLLFLSPLLAFAGPLGRAKRQALLDYGALVGAHGRLVRRRWIEGREIEDDAVLGAPELGPVADTATLYEAVENMRPIPLSKRTVAPLALAAVLPMLVVVAIQVPIVEILKKLLGALI